MELRSQLSSRGRYFVHLAMGEFNNQSSKITNSVLDFGRTLFIVRYIYPDNVVASSSLS